MTTIQDDRSAKKYRYGAYDVMRQKNRMAALESFGIDRARVERIDQEMKAACGIAGKRWSIHGCFDIEDEKKSS